MTLNLQVGVDQGYVGLGLGIRVYRYTGTFIPHQGATLFGASICLGFLCFGYLRDITILEDNQILGYFQVGSFPIQALHGPFIPPLRSIIQVLCKSVDPKPQIPHGKPTLRKPYPA